MHEVTFAHQTVVSECSNNLRALIKQLSEMVLWTAHQSIHSNEQFKRSQTNSLKEVEQTKRSQVLHQSLFIPDILIARVNASSIKLEKYQHVNCLSTIHHLLLSHSFQVRGASCRSFQGCQIADITNCVLAKQEFRESGQHNVPGSVKKGQALLK